MRRLFLYLFILCSLCSTSYKDEKNQSIPKILDEVAESPSMHVEGKGFHVDVPEGWTTKDTLFGDIPFYFLKPPLSAMAGNTSINIIHEQMQNFSIATYYEGKIADMKQQLPGFEPKDNGEIEASGLNGKWFRYDLFVSGVKSEVVNYVFTKDNIAYIITSGTPAGKMSIYRNTFDTVARSFRITD